MSQNSIVFVKLHCTVRATSIYELLLSSNCRPFYCLSCFASQLVITPLVPSNVWPMHCLFCFNLRLVAIPLVSSIVWTLHCLFCFNLRLVAIPLVSSNVWTWHCLSCFYSQLLITPSVSSNDWPFYYLFASFHIFWLPLCYLQSFLSFICFQNLFDESMIMIIRYWDLST